AQRLAPLGRGGRDRDPRGRRAVGRRRDRPAVPHLGAGGDRPPLGPGDRPPPEAQVGPRPRPARGAGARPPARPRPGRPDPPARVLARRGREVEALAPDSVAALRALLEALEGFGVDPARVALDLGYGRGIGFYTQVIFEVTAPTPDGRAVEVGGGGRYDGLA